jgi:hypothetical protein
MEWETEFPGIAQLMHDCWQLYPQDRPTAEQVVQRMQNIVNAMPDD